MPGRVPPPTRIKLEGGSYVSGDIELVPGVGVDGTQEARRFTLDSPNLDPRQPASVFVPGALAPGVVAQFRAIGDDSIAYLDLLEINLLTAPAVASPTDCMSVKVRGSVSGSQEVRCNDVLKRFSWYGQDSTQVAAHDVNAGSTGNAAARGALSDFVMTADVTITAVAFAAANTTPGIGVRKVYEILDGDRTTVLASSDIFDTALGAVEGTIDTPRNLSSAVLLEQGERYCIAVRAVDAGAAAFSVRGATYEPANWEGAIEAPGGGAFGAGIALRQTAGGGSWIAGAGDTSTDWEVSFPGGFQFGLYGQNGGVTITGEPIVEVVQVGTGGTPGADANVRMVWRAE